MHRNFHSESEKRNNLSTFIENNKTKPTEPNKTKQKQFSYKTQSNQLFSGLFTELCKLEPSVRFIRRQNDEWISVVGAACAIAIAFAVCVVYAI